MASTVTTLRPLDVLTGPNPGLGIGNVESSSFNEYFHGLIDEVRITSQALSPSQFLDAPLSGSLTANITRAPVTVAGLAALDKVYDHTTNAVLNVSNTTVAGLIGNDNVTVSSGTGIFASKDVGTNIPVTVSGVTLGGPKGGDYAIVPSTATLSANITPAPVTATGLVANKVYDGTTSATLTLASATLSGAFSGDAVTLTANNATAAFATKDVQNNVWVTFSGMSLSGAQAGDYTLRPTTTANITAAPLTVTGIMAADKVYDGTTAASVTTAGVVLHGVLAGDTVMLTTAPLHGVFASRNVGTGITVTVSGLTLTGPQALDYTIVPTLTGNISPKMLSVSGLTVANKVYDGTTAATLNSGASLTGVVAGDTVTLVTSGATAVFAGKDVGTGITVTVSGLSLAGAQAVTLNTTGAKAVFAGKDVGNNIAVAVSGLTLSGAQASDYTLVQPGAAQPAGVVAYWRFEEGTANQPATAANSIVDSSGNGLNGTPRNGPLYSSDVAVNSIPSTGAANNLSLAFNTNPQPRGPGQFIAIPDNPLFQLTHSLTLEAYIKLSAFQGFEQQIVFRGDDQSGRDPYLLEIRGDQLMFRVEDANDDEVPVSTPFSSYVGQWVHVAGSLDDSTGKMSLYINGNLVATNVTNVRPYAVLTGPNPGLGIGNVESSTCGEYFHGLIDEVRITGQALSPSQFLDGALASGPLTANITPAPLTVTGITAANKTVDGNTTAVLNTSAAQLVGVFQGDTVTLNTANATGTFASSKTGKNITVSVSGLTISGPQAGDYTLTQPTTTADITPPLPAVTINNISRLEGTTGAVTAFTFQVSLSAAQRSSVTYDVFTSDGTAKGGVNYVTIKAGDQNAAADVGTVTFASGQVHQTVTVYVKVGSLLPSQLPTASFHVSLSDPSRPGVPPATGTARIIAQARKGGGSAAIVAPAAPAGPSIGSYRKSVALPVWPPVASGKHNLTDLNS